MATFLSLLIFVTLCQFVTPSLSDVGPFDVGGVSGNSDVTILLPIEKYFCNNDESVVCPGHFRDGNISESYSEIVSTLPVIPPLSPSSSCCNTCSCKDDCISTGTCCPEMIALFPNVTTRTMCVRPQLRPVEPGTYSNLESSFYMLRGCSVDKSDPRFDESIRKCEYAEDYNDLDVKVPVTYIHSRVTYINRYCAICNNVSEEELVYWKAEMNCDSDNIAAGTTAESIVEEILKTETCNVVMKSPDVTNTGIKECKQIISACNVSGYTPYYDSKIEEACKAYTRIYDFEYRNVFCYMCNVDEEDMDYEAQTDCSYWHRHDNFPFDVSFSALLQIRPGEAQNNPESTEGLDCGPHQVYDVYKEVCRNLTCFPPRVFTGDRCTHPYKAMSGVFYRFFLKLMPLKQTDEAGVELLQNDINVYTNILKLNMYDLFQYFNTRSFVKLMSIEDENGTIHRLDYLLLQIDVYIELGTFVNESLVAKIMQVHNTVVTMNDKTKQELSFNASFIMAHFLTVSEGVMYDSVHGDQLVELGHQTKGSTDSENKLHFEVVIPPNLCPLVALEPDEFEFILYQGGVFVKNLETNISRNNYVHLKNSSPNNTIYVCKTFFQNITEGLSLRYAKHENKPTPSILVLLTLVLSSLSIFFSILTLITYILFEELRTQPGINNIMLISSLICAQLLFQFGIGQAQSVSEWACQLIGALIHFSWLLTLMWMNVCSIHTLRVFRSLTQISSNESIAKTTFVYMAYCCIAAIFPVVINIALSDGTMGYGGDLCYITSYKMNLYLFFLPVGIIVVVNMSLFFGVIFTITKMPKIQSNTSKNRNFAKIYLKISSLTGITWLFGFVYALTEIEVFEYIHLILNAGFVGVFIFISFVCNGRILNLYKNLIRPVKSKYTARTQPSDVGAQSESKQK